METFAQVLVVLVAVFFAVPWIGGAYRRRRAAELVGGLVRVHQLRQKRQG